MKTVLRVVLVLMVLVVGATGALAENNPSVTGRFRCVSGANTYDVNVTAVQHKDGSVTGRLKLHQVFDNGTIAFERVVDDPVDELVIVGNRAYGRAGQTFFAIQDSGEGANAAPDKFMPLFFLSPSPPPLSVFLGFLSNFLPVGGLDASLGNAQVRD